MLVPSMTLDEIRKEFARDFPMVHHKAGYVAKQLKKEHSKDQLAKGFVKFYDYCSKYKNQWIYRIESVKKEMRVTYMLLYHNGRGHAAITIHSDMNIFYHTGHFFERYNERRKLGLAAY